jgi:hypothetical protein
MFITCFLVLQSNKILLQGRVILHSQLKIQFGFQNPTLSALL